MTKEQLKQINNEELIEELEQRLVNNSVRASELVTFLKLTSKLIMEHPTFYQEIIDTIKQRSKTK